VSVFAAEGPWLFDRRTDLLAFGGSAALAGALVLVGWATGILEANAPEWVWLGCVLAIDVAHVWSTVFRVYLDPAEVRRRRGLYLGAPALLYLLLCALYAFRPAVFWTALAYVAVWHFVRQQVGWVALYQRREGTSRFDRILDRGTTYVGMLYPILWWHAHLPRAFHWFLEGDFLDALQGMPVDALEPVYWGVLGFWVGRQALRWSRGTPPATGKALVVGTTWACWYGGIVALDGDFAFTVTNVLIHGVPYMVLTYRYGRTREAPWVRTVLRFGIAGFVALLLALAFAEELLWDRVLWHERTWLFGEPFALGALATTLLVPLLALPQATHYVLDGFVWKRRNNPTLASRG